jgi:hypothetical protein
MIFCFLGGDERFYLGEVAYSSFQISSVSNRS